VPASVGLAAESVAADESAGAEESELRVDPTSGIWSANGTWSAAKAPAAPTATAASAIVNAAALRRCDPKRRRRATFGRFFPLSNFVPLPVLELSPAVVSDSTKFSPQCLPLPHPHKNSPLVRAIRRIAWLKPAFNRSNGSFGLAERLTRQVKRARAAAPRRAKEAANGAFPPRGRCRPARPAASCRLV